MVRTVLSLSAALFIAAASGCLALAAGAAAGVGTYAYVRGELTTSYDATLDRTWEAAQRAVDQLGFAVKERAKDATAARLIATDAEGKDIKLALKPQGLRITEVRVRVGVFGDESKSRLILDRIQSNL
jgi:hypothetical protein